MKIYIITFQMPQHALHSGYSQLSRFTGKDVIDFKDRNSVLKFIPTTLSRILPSFTGLKWFDKYRLVSECYVISNMIFTKGNIYHFIYGENSFRYSGLFAKARDHRIICTFHLPPQAFSEQVRYTEHLRKLDAIVVIARSQIDFFARFIPRERIFFVPHGIDTDFFRPPPRAGERKDNICLFVGHFLRDFKTFREMIRIVRSANSSIQFVVITWQEDFKYLQGEEGVILKTEIGDEELLRYYQESTLLVQPMEDCTANNSILEGMACGCPVIATDIGGVRDYLDESCAVLVPPRDPKNMAEAVLGLFEDKTRLKQMSENVRQKVLQFSWPRIAEKMGPVYKQVEDM